MTEDEIIDAEENDSLDAEIDEGEELERHEAELTDELDPLDEISDTRPETFISDLSLKGQIEAILFASPKPMTVEDIIPLLCMGEDPVLALEVKLIMEKLVSKFEGEDSGFCLVNLGTHGYQFQTLGSAAPNMEKLFASRPRPLSRAALETLTIVAYRQPCTRAVVEFIRGVDSGSIMKNLLDRDLIRCVGRREDLGRPMLFGTTEEFLQVFGISSLNDLPPLAALQTDSETMATALEDLNKLEQAEGSGEIEVEQYLEDDSRDPDETKIGAPIDAQDIEDIGYSTVSATSADPELSS